MVKSRLARAAVTALVLIGFSLCAPIAHGQRESATAGRSTDAVERAKKLFEDGNAVLNQGRFAEARDLFRSSLALVPRASTAFNLAVALRGTGESTAAVVELEVLLAGKMGALPPDKRDEVKRLLEQVRADLATLHIEACGAKDLVVRINGEIERDVVPCRPFRKTVDAGRYTVTVSAPRAETGERNVVLNRGGVVRVDIRIEQREEEETSLLTSPVFWIGAAVVVAGAATATVLLTTGDSASPTTDPVTGSAVTLTFGP
ncbi:MAG: hypothetical protein KC416_06020 [Myxococcales bacterium]|nr:hypothetical protein [Myxococcales bacterium]